MSIYPDGKPKGLMYTWQLAAVDLPIPDQLVSDEEDREWRDYLAGSSPAQQLRKFAQALDQFHDLLTQTGNPLLLPKEDQIKLSSKWNAACIAGQFCTERLRFTTEELDTSRPFKSNIEREVFFVKELLKSVNSPDIPAWDKRLEQHAQFCGQDWCDQFLKLKHEETGHGYGFVVRDKPSPQKPSAGPASQP